MELLDVSQGISLRKSHLEVASVGVALHVALAEDASLAYGPRGDQLSVDVSVPARHDCTRLQENSELSTRGTTTRMMLGAYLSRVLLPYFW